MKKLVIVMTSIIVLFVLGGLILPSDFEVKRSVSINANTPTIHQFVNELNKWTLWAPWLDIDPSIKTTLGAITRGKGASQSWSGSGGGGSLEFTSSSIETGIEYDLYFEGDPTRYFSSISYAETDQPIEVTWLMKGKIETVIIGPYVAMMMDTLVGDMFQDGLNKLKIVVETDK